MLTRPFGRSGLVVGRLALGTWTFGEQTPAEDAAQQIRTFFDAGGTLIDTADVYAATRSESILGEILSSYDRDSFVLATKAFGRTKPGPMGEGRSRGHLLSALDASLRRLRVDYLDLWQIHAYGGTAVPAEETLAALDTAVASGKVRYVGVSNYRAWQLTFAATRQSLTRQPPIISNQVEYSLLKREPENELVDAADFLGVGILAWSPLGRGVLTGKYRSGTPEGSRADTPQWKDFVNPLIGGPSDQIVDAVTDAANELGTSPANVALSWVRDRPGVTAPIIGARTNEQLVANLESESLTLPTEIATKLTALSSSAA
ncbi:oxidoreductase [Microlunatus endophyticus]|uniref:Oxidoreductase n=1 Tax=Microlunatus endophyticus TaxID=1716077 RepID=A0A917S4D3_9ACTN|nr:aldo/keto reductase [Microlunatus endophyticus]GGL56203.1 oxidoreductase [Microlunatus endophyticus]